MAHKFDVIVVGELNVDLILDGADREMEIGKEIIAKKMTLTLGSSSAIFASNLSSLQKKVSFLGKIGDDNYASIVTESLKAKNVDISNIILDKNDQTGITVVVNYDEDRANITYPGTMNLLTIEDIKDDVLKQAKHMHLSSVFLQDGIKDSIIDIFKKAKSLGLTTSLDPQWDPSEEWNLDLEKLLPYVDIFLPNITEIGFITKTSSVEDAINKVKAYSNYVVIKDGSNGSFLWDKEKIIHQEIFNNPNVADCIGAGDSFNSGFISKFVEGADLKTCLEFGSLTGAINTTQAGGTTAFSDIGTIKETASSKFNFKI
jgi:sugar/nucleoside kinase (ribokinase family)